MRQELVLADRATHLFEESGAMDEVARFAVDWFERYLAATENRSIDDIC